MATNWQCICTALPQRSAATRWIFTKLTALMDFGTKMNTSDFGVKKLKFRVTLE